MNVSERIHGVELELVPAAAATLPITDLTIRRGFGAFDFLRVVDGVPLFVEDHLARLERTADLLGLAPRPDLQRLRSHVRDVISANDHGSFGLQLFLTGGDPKDGVLAGTPRLLVLVVDLPAYPESAYRDGVALLPHRYQRDLPEAKTTNYFTGIRLEPAMRAAGATDVLYHDGGRILETSRCNVFVGTHDGRFATPGRDVLEGVTRRHLLEVLGDRVDVRDVAWEELTAAPEAFLTSTTKGAMPIVRVGDDRIGEGRPGEATGEVMEMFSRVTADWLRRHRSEWRG